MGEYYLYLCSCGNPTAQARAYPDPCQSTGKSHELEKMIYGSCPKVGDPNIDPKILGVPISKDPPKMVPLILGNPPYGPFRYPTGPRLGSR